MGERGVGVGKGVEVEVDDLASIVFEEDEVVEAPAGKDDSMRVDGSVQDEQEDVEMQLQMPNGTAGSAKEVELSLQDDEEDHPDPKTSRKDRGESMDVDVAPLSTTARPDKSSSPDKVQTKTTAPVTPLRSPTKPITYSSKTKQARRKIIHESSEEEDEGQENETLLRKVKSKPLLATKASKVPSQSDQEDEESVTKRKQSKLSSKTRGKAKAASDEEVIDLSDSDDVPQTVKQVQRVNTPTPAGRGSDVEQEEEEVVVKLPPKTKASKLKPTPKVSEKVSLKSKAIRKAATKSRRIKTTPESEDDVVEVKVASVANIPLESKRKAEVVDSDEKELEEDEVVEEEIPKFKIGKPTGKRKPTKAEAKKGASSKTLETTPENDDDDDQPLEEPTKTTTPKKPSHSSTDKASSSKNKARTGATGLADAINAAVTPVSGAGLLKKTKADARTRIKRKAVREVMEEESNGEDGVNIAKSSKVRKTGRKGRTLDSDEEENESGDGKFKGRTIAKPKQPLDATSTNRTKPRRFHSSDDEEDSSNIDDDDDDDSLPAAPHLQSKAESRKKGKRKALPADETEAPISAKQKPTNNDKNLASSSRRTVTVVISSPKAKSKQPKVAEEEASDQEMKKRPKSRNTTKTVASKPVKATLPQSEEEVVPPKSRIGRGKQESAKKETAPRRPAVHERKPSSSIDIDETPSTSSAAPPRRNAATKAQQHLHDTLMPDLVNFEAQMKKSKGKSRMSTSSYGAFALGSEPETEVEVGGKRRKRRAEEEGTVEDEVSEAAGNPKKKRRVSDQNEAQPEAQFDRKANGKRKVEKEETSESGFDLFSCLSMESSLTYCV